VQRRHSCPRRSTCNGQIITRRDRTASSSTIDQGSTPALKDQHYVYVNGQQVAHYDESTTVDVLSQVTAFSNSNGTGDYVVQEGDTLKSIAQAVYGNASLWYVVAQANALNGDADLAVGLSLSIPAVTTSKNDSTTFKPYNPSEIQGSTTPNLPVIAPPPPPPKQHCNVIAAIVVIAVVVAASFIVGPLAAAALQSGIAGIAVGAAAGSAAGQLAGDALGTHQGFSFGEVFTAAATAVVTAGVGEYLNTVGEVGFVAHAIQGAAGYVAQDAVEKLTGEPAHFSWAGLVANSVASGVASEFGPTEEEVRAGTTASAFEIGSASLVQGVVQRETSSALGDNHVQSWESIGENAAGSYLGAAVGNAFQPNVATRQSSPYTFDITKGGQGVPSGDPLDGYRSSDFPSVASSNMYATYAGAYGPGGYREESGYASAEAPSPGADREVSELVWPQPGSSPDASYPTRGPLYNLGVGTIPVQVPYLAPSLSNEAEVTAEPSMLEASQGLARLSAWADVEAGISTLPVRAGLAPKAAPLPDVEALYDIQPGWFAQSHAIAAAGANDPTNTPFQRGVFTVLDGLALPMVLAEEAVRATGNAPAQAGVSAQWAARASLESNSDDSLTDISNSLCTGGNALFGLAGGAGFAESAAVDTVLGSKISSFSSEGLQLSGSAGNYTLRSPFYLDATPGQLNSGIPLGIRNPLVSAENSVASEAQAVSQVAVDESASSVQTIDKVSFGAPNTMAASIGKSGYASVQEFSDVAYAKYQGLVDEGYARADEALQSGKLQVPAGVSEKTVLGQFTDDYARVGMKDWLADEGIEEGAGQVIQVNRYLYDPAGTGAYRIPDVSFPGASQIYDATLGFKSWSTPQVRGFYQYSNGSAITIVRPVQLGGSYSVLVPR